MFIFEINYYFVVVFVSEKNGCTFVRTTDFAPCAGNADTDKYTISMTSENCASKIPSRKASRTFPCNKPVKAPKG